MSNLKEVYLRISAVEPSSEMKKNADQSVFLVSLKN